ncbi:MAG: PHP domain-containing protein [Chloroflexi bacterium]|nr:PHP domain-containing protein [Chloroflexota bacterium]
MAGTAATPIHPTDRETILAVDGHVHSTWSDGASTTDEALAAADAAGLRGVCLVDHVRATTTWLPAMVREVETLRERAPIDVRIGVETKVLDTRGALDVPDRLDGVEVVLVADHRFPGSHGPIDPAVVRTMLRAGSVRPQDVVRDLIGALAASLDRLPLPIVLAHPFSLLPKMGLAETDVPQEALLALAVRCRETGTAVEINEKWRCPGVATLDLLRSEGVGLVAGSDAHHAREVGRWDAVRRALETLDGSAGAIEGGVAPEAVGAAAGRST